MCFVRCFRTELRHFNKKFASTIVFIWMLKCLHEFKGTPVVHTFYLQFLLFVQSIGFCLSHDAQRVKSITAVLINKCKHYNLLLFWNRRIFFCSSHLNALSDSCAFCSFKAATVAMPIYITFSIIKRNIEELLCKKKYLFCSHFMMGCKFLRYYFVIFCVRNFVLSPNLWL